LPIGCRLLAPAQRLITTEHEDITAKDEVVLDEGEASFDEREVASDRDQSHIHGGGDIFDEGEDRSDAKEGKPNSS
jgi:hypothetical protein